ncbi:hypothetical protein EC968_010070 [Mortierella alpina]|nr:hypothetical protein EC968_010070 [Mortierella alpina]
MGETQSFRVAGPATCVENIDVDNIDGQKVIFWEDIEQVFPGVQHIRNGSSVDQASPYQYYPDATLDVVFSSAVDHTHVDSPLATPNLVSAHTTTAHPLVNSPANENLTGTESTVVETLQVTSAPAETATSDNLASSGSSTFQAAPKTTMSFRQAVQLVTNMRQRPDGQIHLQTLNAKMDHMLKLQVAFDAKQEEFNQLQSRSNAQLQEMKQLEKEAFERQAQMLRLSLDHQKEMKQLQIQAPSQLAVIQERIKAVMTQTYELHEFPIPRLFVVLP